MQATSLFNGVNGLKSFTEGLGIVADNLANTSTYGYKSSRAEFADMLYSELSDSDPDLTTEIDQVGQGSYAWAQQIMNQGAIESTGNTLDMAIDGNGFFTVRDVATDSLYYTRAGQFGLDGTVGQEGYIINSEGYRLQGYALDATGQPVIAALVDMQIPVANMPGAATSLVGFGINLNAADTQKSSVATSIDPTDSGTYNYTSSVTVYDANGATHELALYYQRVDDYGGETPADGESVWKVATFEDQDGSLSANPADPANTFYLHFSDSGALVGVTDSDGANLSTDSIALTMDFGTAGAETITFDFAPNGAQASTQFGDTYSVNAVTQDGYAEGDVASVEISEDGYISVTYTNGEVTDVGVLALATFASTGDLAREGSNLWSATADSGAAVYGVPTDEALALGSIEDEALEASTVDTATEMVNMILYQRAFQANSKSVTTSDEMLKTAINLKT